MPNTPHCNVNRWSALFAILLTLTALSCADYPSGAQEPGRAIQPDMRFNADEDSVLTRTADDGVLAQIQEADPATWTVATAGTLTSDESGSVEMSSDGSFTYTPAADFEGNDYLTVTIAGDTGGEGDYIILFAVAGSNDPPEAENDSVEAEEDTALTITPLTNDTDVDLDDSRAIVSVEDPDHGSVAADLDTGEVIYTPAANFNGEDSFAYTIADLAGEESSAVVTITVTAVNDAPAATADDYAAEEDRALTVAAATGVLGNDTDVDGDDLEAAAGTLATAQGGSVEMASDGSFTYTPARDFSGEDSFAYTVSDGELEDQATATVSVAAVNDAPTARNDSYNAQEDAVLTVTAGQGVLANDSDVDGDTLIAVGGVIATAKGGSVSLDADGGFSYTPDDDFFGTDSFTYSASDSRGGLDSATVTFTVAGVADAPVAVNDTAEVDEGGTVQIDVLANDFDPDVTGTSSLTIVAAGNGANGNVQIQAGRTVTYTPDPDFVGTDSFTYEIEDGDSSTPNDTARVNVTVNNVNDAPVAAPDRYEVEEETQLVVTVAEGVLANDTDPDGDNLTVVDGTFDTAQGGSVRLFSTGRFRYDPAEDFVGTDSFEYTVTDGEEEDTATVTIEVTNIAPVAVDDNDPDDNEPSPFDAIYYGESRSIDALANDTDGPVTNPGTGLTITRIRYDGTNYTDPDVTIAVGCGDLTWAADGTLVISRVGQPLGTFFCDDGESLTYTITDSAGATDVGRVWWQFEAGTRDSDDNTLSSPPANLTDEDEAFSGDVLSGAGPAWSVSTTGPVATLFGGTATVSANGGFSYTPPPHFNGSDSFAFTATGGNPPAQGRALVTVTPLNDAPLAQADRYAVAPGGSLDLSAAEGLLANDSDLEGAALSVTAVNDGGLSGTLVVQPSGAFTYLAPIFAADTETFTYTVTDGSASQTATVIIDYDAATVPFAAADSYSTAEDTTLNIGGSGVRNNDSGGVAASAGALSRFGGSVNMSAGGAFGYTPPPNFSGTDSFTYTLSDGGVTVNGLVRISVTARGDAPLAGDDFYTVGRDTPSTATAAGGLLTNDTDADGDSLTITTTGVQGTDAGGEVEIFADGGFVYGPPAGFTGTDRFDYSVDDGNGNGAAATVIVTVVP